ncbi:unnamed protein product [Ophioblennius macclurei]
MADPSQSWWKVTFLKRKKSQSKVLHEVPAECVSAGAPPHAEVGPQDCGLDARLERIVDKTTATKGPHMKVSHSGRYKEKKKVRATLADNPQMFPGDDSSRDQNERARSGRKEKEEVTG